MLNSQVKEFLETSKNAHMNLDIPIQKIRQNAQSIKIKSKIKRSLFNIKEYNIQDSNHKIDIKLYTPSKKSTALIIYFHGGGFVFGSLEESDSLCKEIAYQSDFNVLAVDYRLAPENPYPAALEDAEIVSKWIIKNHQQLGIDIDEIAVCGDSAGGAIATFTAQHFKSWTKVSLKHQMLWYPAIDFDMNRESYKKYGHGYLLEIDIIKWFLKQYFGNRKPVSLIPNDNIIQDIPPTTIISSTYDPLQDENKDYASFLIKNNIDVHFKMYEGMIHTFISMFEKFDIGREAIQWSCTQLKEYLKNK